MVAGGLECALLPQAMNQFEEKPALLLYMVWQGKAREKAFLQKEEGSPV